MKLLFLLNLLRRFCATLVGHKKKYNPWMYGSSQQCLPDQNKIFVTHFCCCEQTEPGFQSGKLWYQGVIIPIVGYASVTQTLMTLLYHVELDVHCKQRECHLHFFTVCALLNWLRDMEPVHTSRQIQYTIVIRHSNNEDTQKPWRGALKKLCNLLYQ